MKIRELPTSRNLSILNLDLLLKGFDVNVLYSNAKPDKESVYPEIECGCTFRKGVNDKLVVAFINQIFTKTAQFLN